MAARKANSEKTVLSRQAIASRKKSISEQRLKAGGTSKRALVGVFLLAVSVLAMLSLATFDPHDRIGPRFHNAAGPVGHSLAELLLSALGVCAFVVPACGIYAAMALFVGSRKRRWPQWLAAVMLVGSGSVLLQLFETGKPGWSYPPGGFVGLRLSATLSGLFSTLGTVVLVSAICVSALIVGSQLAFLRLCSVMWVAACALGVRLRSAALEAWSWQKATIAKSREEAAKAKLEEAAFLAQLEADEDEVLSAEEEADEADAVAEEAMKLAREAEERQAAARKEKAKAKVPIPEPITEPRMSTEPVAPGADPAWVAMLTPRLASKPEPIRKRDRKGPQISLPPAPSGSSPNLNEALGAAQSSPKILPADASTSVEPSVALAALTQAPLPAPTPAALARTPVIVEPKAPPRPTKKKDSEQFEFVGGRTSFTLPPLDVLECDRKERTAIDKDVFLATAEKLRGKLADFGITGEVVEIRPGPVVTMYEFLPGPGIKVSKIASLSDDLAMAMEAMRVRIVAPIPGKGVVGIEVPNRDRETVYLKEIAEQDLFAKSASKLTMCLGKDIEGMPFVFDLAKAPHLLMAGTTGSGKSVAVNSMIMSILLKATPEEVRFIMVDPKMLELSVYEGIPHLLLPVVTDPKKAALALRWAVEEMERRYHLLSEAGVRNISGYNKLVEASQGPARELLKSQDSKSKKLPAPGGETVDGVPPKKMLIVDVAEGETEDDALARSKNGLGVATPWEPVEELRESLPEEPSAPPIEPADEESPQLPLAARVASGGAEDKDVPKKEELKKLPFIVVIIDELADLMMVASREVETYIARLAQMARAAGIHLMVATQRPSTDVVTGVIKANFPTRITFMLRSKPDSMTIIGTVGAEALLGMGDMLIMPPTSSHLQRVHGAYVSEGEIKKAVDHLKAQGKPVYDESILKPREEDVEGSAQDDELSDELYDQALAAVGEMKTVSISMLQRKMRIGYNRAARMIERMERDGIVGPADGARPREVRIRPVGEMPGADAI